ncbi:uncharacterized protein BX663DRAFT_494476 [Cokeromyces recurvatus]|uniref:uncharacterized protein n=1 Tax=Cokeromyces recurvatus TaxID=90255 RepID=UPI002220BD0D|nr:uncharacterized protein BX663DRAFT_494476 [Cokeromyces recurvatus]KAI7907004.1 hypothetical protein BX663DRAFT_494476 [Cokeromyces recurvatus]
MSIFQLPTEIWKEIFKHLKKDDLKKCLPVSKSWHHMINPLLGDNLYINLHDLNFPSLLTDLTIYPTFGPKITHITISSESSDLGRPEMLRSIINHCPNLIELQFDNLNPYEYLKILNSRETLMPHIQAIKLLNHLVCSPAVRRFHLWVNYRFRATIQSIDIMDIDDNGALKNYGGLVMFISDFPNLIELRACCDFILREEVNVINLTSLLNNSKKLKVLHLNHFSKIIDTPEDVPSDDVIRESPLTNLQLGVLRLDIKPLQYVMARFQNLSSFCLTANNIEPDHVMGFEASDKVVCDFHTYFKNIDRYAVNYTYKGEHFFDRNIIETSSIVDANDILLEDLVNYFEDDMGRLYTWTDEGNSAYEYFNHLDHEDMMYYDDELDIDPYFTDEDPTSSNLGYEFEFDEEEEEVEAEVEVEEEEEMEEEEESLQGLWESVDELFINSQYAMQTFMAHDDILYNINDNFEDDEPIW